MFRTVLEQSNETLFDDCLRGFLNRISLTTKTSSFKKYFECERVPRKHQWAYCFRAGFGINTNMFVEAFHKVFKYQYLKGKTNKRLDNCVLNRLKYVRHKTFDRLIKLTKGKATTCVNMIHERHMRSVTLPTGSVKTKDTDSWSVLGEDGRSTYKVSKLLNACSDPQNCQLKCSECRICVHLYVCNCSLIASTICKHIHLVCRYSTSQENDTVQLDDIQYPDNTKFDQQDDGAFEAKAEMNFLKVPAKVEKPTGKEERSQSKQSCFLLPVMSTDATMTTRYSS